MKPGPFDQVEFSVKFSSAHGEQLDAAFESMMRRNRSSFEALTEETGASTADVHVRLARCADDRAAVDRLVALRYAWRGYVTQPSDQGPSSACLTLLACRGDQPVGTLTMGVDQSTGLLVDEANREIVDGLRHAGRRIVELRRLAVQDPVDSKAVLAHLFRAAYCTGRLAHGATDVLIEVIPRHASFYARIFGFVRLGDEWICARVNTRAVLMRLDVAELDRRLSHRGARNTQSGAGGSARGSRELATVAADL